MSISYLRDKYDVSTSPSPMKNVDDPNSSQNIFQKSFNRDTKISEMILSNDYAPKNRNFDQYIDLE